VRELEFIEEVSMEFRGAVVWACVVRGGWRKRVAIGL